MPRYFFTIFDGRGYVDTEGTELADLNAAQVYAIQYAGEVILNEAPRIGIHSNWHLEVTDKDGCIILRLDFKVTPPSTSTAVSPNATEQAPPRTNML